MMTIAERLALNKYDVDPAECFKLREGKVGFAYEGCLECGSCRIVCDKSAIEWSYPRGGFGISFEFG
ncbi:MAG: hypothetical protein NTU41_02335 [Chloroflexi bacterium]|nr:hypothetical protein [Chloroflexota bacterium]